MTYKIRLSAEDTMSCVDLLTHLGADLAGMSQASVVRNTLSLALEHFRNRGLIPRRTMADFDTVMSPFILQREALDARRAALKLS